MLGMCDHSVELIDGTILCCDLQEDHASHHAEQYVAQWNRDEEPGYLAWFEWDTPGDPTLSGRYVPEPGYVTNVPGGWPDNQPTVQDPTDGSGA